MYEYLLISPVPVPAVEEMVNDPDKLQQALAFKTLYWQTNRLDVDELAKEYCVITKGQDVDAWYAFDSNNSEWLPIASNAELVGGLPKYDFSGIKAIIANDELPPPNANHIILNKIANFVFQKNDLSQQDAKNLKEGFFNIFGKDNNGNYISNVAPGVFEEIPVLEEYQKSRFEWLQNFKKQVA